MISKIKAMVCVLVCFMHISAHGIIGGVRKVINECNTIYGVGTQDSIKALLKAFLLGDFENLDTEKFSPDICEVCSDNVERHCEKHFSVSEPISGAYYSFFYQSYTQVLRDFIKRNNFKRKGNLIVLETATVIGQNVSEQAAVFADDITAGNNRGRSNIVANGCTVVFYLNLGKIKTVDDASAWGNFYPVNLSLKDADFPSF
jgi:hypothetical protein